MAWRLAGRDLLVGERVAQCVAALEAAGEAEQLVLDLVERAFGAGDLEQCPCVAVDAVVAHALAPTRAMKFSMSSCCVASSSEPLTTWSTAALRQPGDLGTQLVADAAAGGGDVG